MTVENKKPIPEDIEAFLHDAFEQNFERIRAESGHGLSPEVKETALQQVLLYWRRLREEVAEHVTDTEVRLNLPGQKTPRKREFCVEGIVDIIREGGRTVMYDIKTHDPGYVHENLDMYEQQMNVYAHIWQNLRGQDLDEIAVIATPFPRELKEAWEDREREPKRFEHELAKWQPVLRMDFKTERVAETIKHFSEVVDRIESGCFIPRPSADLAQRESHGKTAKTFAQRVCLNCDARFTCRSYRKHMKVARSGASAKLRKLFADYGPVEEQEDRLAAVERMDRGKDKREGASQ